MKKEMYVKPQLTEMVLESGNTLCACTRLGTPFSTECTELPEDLQIYAADGDVNFYLETGCHDYLAEYCVFTSASTLFTS